MQGREALVLLLILQVLLFILQARVVPSACLDSRTVAASAARDSQSQALPPALVTNHNSSVRCLDRPWQALCTPRVCCCMTFDTPGCQQCRQAPGLVPRWPSHCGSCAGVVLVLVQEASDCAGSFSPRPGHGLVPAVSAGDTCRVCQVESGQGGVGCNADVRLRGACPVSKGAAPTYLLPQAPSWQAARCCLVAGPVVVGKRQPCNAP
jgi:hypothetical protein